jgi:hypothetical protein
VLAGGLGLRLLPKTRAGYTRHPPTGRGCCAPSPWR